MTKLWVANTTRQVYRFTYRVSDKQHQMHEIPAGRQICLDHLQQAEIDSVIKQNTIYGMREANETPRRKGFSGLVYRIGDDPINLDRLLETYEANDEVRDAEATERMKKSAAALSDNIANTVHKNTGVDRERMRPARVEVETIESTDGKPTISKGVEVVRAGVQPQRGRMS
jgi:uncharacterized protein YdcH (DUF465 family)